MAFIEEEILLKARSFDRHALTTIYDEYNEALFRYAYRRLGSEDLAEECVAETFQRFLEALEKGKGPKNYLRAYLYRIAHNWITDFYRRPRPEDPGLPEHITSKEPHIEESLMKLEQNDHVREALMQIPSTQQQVIVLKFLEEWDNEEIAKSIHKSVGAVKALQNRGLNQLRKYFESVKS